MFPLAAGPFIRSGANAAAHPSMVVVDELGCEPAMTDSLRSPGLSDVQACWASRVLDADDQLLGAISLYALEDRTPSRAETSVLAIGAAPTDLMLARQRERCAVLHSTLADVSADGALVYRDGEVLCANVAHAATDLAVTSTPQAHQGRDATLRVWRDPAPAPGVRVPADAEEDRVVADREAWRALISPSSGTVVQAPAVGCRCLLHDAHSVETPAQIR